MGWFTIVVKQLYQARRQSFLIHFRRLNNGRGISHKGTKHKYLFTQVKKAGTVTFRPLKTKREKMKFLHENEGGIN